MMLLYIDPGTGSMLLSLFIGLATAATFGLRALFLKLHFFLIGGKKGSFNDINKHSFVIFSDHKRYWNIFGELCDLFEKNKVELLYYTCSEDDPVFDQKYEYIKAEFIGSGNNAFARLNSLYADIVISTTPHLDVYQWKRSKNVKCYVHVPHTVDDLSGYRMFGLDYYDAVLASGQNQVDFIRKIEDLRPGINKKELAVVGSLPLDKLKKRYDKEGRTEENPVKVVLIAPSWGPSGILRRFGKDFLKAIENTGYKVIVRPHPQMMLSEKEYLDPLIKEFNNIEWNFDNDNFNVLNRADVLITDFSGIIFDWCCVFNKPLIYADISFDTLPYDADWLSEKMWALRAVEAMGVKLQKADFNRLNDVIEHAENDEVLLIARKNISSECWDCIGKSPENVYKWLIEKKDS